MTSKLKVNSHWMLSKQSDDVDGAATDVDGNGEDDIHYGDKDD